MCARSRSARAARFGTRQRVNRARECHAVDIEGVEYAGRQPQLDVFALPRQAGALDPAQGQPVDAGQPQVDQRALAEVLDQGDLAAQPIFGGGRCARAGGRAGVLGPDPDGQLGALGGARRVDRAGQLGAVAQRDPG